MEQFDKNDFRGFTLIGTPITAAPVDMSKYLEPGEIDIGNKTWNDVFVPFTKNELKNLGIKYYTISPITIFKRSLFEKLVALEATRIIFQNREDMLKWLKQHKNLLIYQVIKNTLRDTYAVRFFQYDSINLKVNWLLYWYNRLFIWKNRI